VIPEDELTIQTRGTVLGDVCTSRLVSSNPCDAVLVLGVKNGIVFATAGSQVDLVLEHAHGRGRLLYTTSGLLVNLGGKGPLSRGVGSEVERIAIVTNGNNVVLVNPYQSNQRKIGQLEGLSGGRSSIAEVSNREAGVVTDEGKSAARRREGTSVYPASGLIKLGQHLSKSQVVSEGGFSRLLINSLFNESREDPAFEVARCGGNEHIIRVPVNRKNCRLVFLDVLADPPIVILFKVANGYALSTTAYSELVLKWAPLYRGGSTIDTEDYECWLPCVFLPGPHVGISVLRAGHNTVGLGGPINARDGLVVLLQNVLQSPLLASGVVNVQLVVVRAESEFRSVTIPSVTSNSSSKSSYVGISCHLLTFKF